MIHVESATSGMLLYVADRLTTNPSRIVLNPDMLSRNILRRPLNCNLMIPLYTTCWEDGAMRYHN